MQGEPQSSAEPTPNSAARLIPQIDLNACSGCGYCAALCPVQAVALLCGYAVIVRPDQCIYCDICETLCPEDAISRPFTVEFAPDQRRSSAQQAK